MPPQDRHRRARRQPVQDIRCPAAVQSLPGASAFASERAPLDAVLVLLHRGDERMTQLRRAGSERRSCASRRRNPSTDKVVRGRLPKRRCADRCPRSACSSPDCDGLVLQPLPRRWKRCYWCCLLREASCVKRRQTVDQDRRRRVDHPLGCGDAAPRLEARSAA